jgi:hypothetical protein
MLYVVAGETRVKKTMRHGFGGDGKVHRHRVGRYAFPCRPLSARNSRSAPRAASLARFAVSLVDVRAAMS